MTSTRTYIKQGTVNRESWLCFLEEITRYEDGKRLINGTRLTDESDSRAIYRWRSEGATPTWFRVDEFLCSYGLIFTDFEIWCWVQKKPLWENGAPEGWD